MLSEAEENKAIVRRFLEELTRVNPDVSWTRWLGGAPISRRQQGD